MNIFIDTCHEDLVIALYNHDLKLKSYKIKEKLKQKAEILPKLFEEFLYENDLKTKDIQNFYINLGPGTFTGVRIALVFVRTIAQVTNANVFTTNSFNLISFGNELKQNYFIDAKGKTAYKAIAQNGKILSNIEVVSKEVVNSFDYLFIINNFLKLVNKNVFEHQKNLLKIQPLYVKKMQIGSTTK
ncbi:tRNA (adenosine(37)-N6)-threonylcarbamoyltransferase complex dimerization subunit type 1 TsaB [Mesomycoplasma neurolyticum]|uniref:Molecular chaperone n=1 Tax=Mesomycoplasma neurolyticum TaxID=2120 RepID=A0A449A4I7_9BACT|nr:tRNA (adenosine(37)-N6)-threonylcarbamoyltransferase complex dimerization subunit type 1 TsaB [Mesomycoplasma neurolyticum]VEU59083.1 molecular chaperone [Mesomycoplasma neurolyticum]